MRVLPIPPDASGDSEALEVVRAWIVQGGLQVSLAPWAWADQPGEWGRLLADLGLHMADALAKETGKPVADLREAIREGLLSSLDDEDGDRSGDFVERPQ